MTQVGNTLTGLAIGILCMPRGSRAASKVAHMAAFAVLANVPDIPLPGWSHERYDISHSIFVNLLLIGLVIFALALSRATRHRIGGWRVMAGGALTWLSHLLLDSFYNHGHGIAIFWPFSDARLVLPVSWFSVMPATPPPVTPQMLQIWLIEFAAYFPLVMLALLGRRLTIRH
jgi:membrane-bound metal-dependent hydrolase YbcI (DUF457 family)